MTLMKSAFVVKLSSPIEQWACEQVELESLLNKIPLVSCYIFLDKSTYPKHEAERRRLLRRFKVPGMVCTDMANRCNGYFGSKVTYDGAGKMTGHTTWFRCLVKITNRIADGGIKYAWSEMTFITRWESGHCVMLCVDTPDSFRDQLIQAVESEQEQLDFSNPFVLHVPLMDQVIGLYDLSVWRVRDLIRPVEKAREKKRVVEADFSQLHEISRHATHSTETLSVTVESVEALLERHKEFQHRSLPTSTAHNARWTATQQQMEFQGQLIRNLKLRSQANQERLQNEITLAYNMITQRDSKVMVEIGAATRSDSTAMKTVAVVTMIFLPATFTSAVFSMSFFNFSPAEGGQTDEWRVSSKIWIYWAVAIPLTGLTLLAWLLWRRRIYLESAFGWFRGRHARRLLKKQCDEA